MQTHEKIRELREVNQWTQEQMADKMALSVNGYAKIERGETRITLQRLEQFAQIFNVDISDLLDKNNKDFLITVSKFFNSNNHNNQIHVYGLPSELGAEIERLHLIISHKDELIAKLNEQISDLRQLNTLLQQKIDGN